GGVLALCLPDLNYCGNPSSFGLLVDLAPAGSGFEVGVDGLVQSSLGQVEIEFANEGGETYICGNPPYYGSRKQEEAQKEDIQSLCGRYIKKWRSLDYVAGWLIKGKEYIDRAGGSCAFVATSSICEGLHVGVLWPHLIDERSCISFAVRPFKWSNLAAKNAGVTVVVVAISAPKERSE